MGKTVKNYFFLLCCPGLVPQIIGEPAFPEDEMENWSVKQSPMAPPKNKPLNM